jgi:hypothetical protein
MVDIDRRAAVMFGVAGAAFLASDTAVAQAGGDAVRNKEILTQAYKR